MNENDNVIIPRDRYDELLDIETRVNVVVDMIARNDYVSMSNILRILGSEYAIDVANDIEKKTHDFSFKGVFTDANNN